MGIANKVGVASQTRCMRTEEFVVQTNFKGPPQDCESTQIQPNSEQLVINLL